jgi:hypothetical protein
MQFILLYGRPAVGKLTVAHALAQLTGYRVFDNHLVVDAVLAVYDFGSPQFVALRDAMWRTAFATIAREKMVPGLIFTFNPENSVPQAFLDDLFAIFAAAKIETRCIELICPEQIIEARLGGADRQQKRKLIDPDLYRRLRAAGAFDTPVMMPDHLVIDTSRHSAAEAATLIAKSLRAA